MHESGAPDMTMMGTRMIGKFACSEVVEVRFAPIHAVRGTIA